MFQRHRRNPAAFVDVTREADEAGDGADVGAARAHRVDFGTEIEGFGLNKDFHLQPPVTGGKIATSA